MTEFVSGVVIGALLGSWIIGMVALDISKEWREDLKSGVLLDRGIVYSCERHAIVDLVPKK